MRLFRLLLILAIANVAALGQTNRWQPRTMSMEDCIEIALHHNLDVQIKRYSPEIARYNLGSLYGAYDPNFSLSAEHDYTKSSGGIDQQGRLFNGNENASDIFSGGFQGLLPWGMSYNLGINLTDRTITRPPSLASTNVFPTTVVDFAGMSTNFSLVTSNFSAAGTNTSVQENFTGQAGAIFQLRQPLLKNFWIDSTRLQIFIDKKNLQISELDLRFQIMTTVTLVEQAYYNLIFSQENIKVQQKALELAERQLAENKKRVEVGAMAPLDEKQAESLAAQSRADLLNALGTEETQQRVLKGLLSDNYTNWENVAIQPTEALVAVPQQFDLQESWRKGLALRPDLRQQKLNLEKQAYTVRFARNQLLPQLDVFGTAGYGASSPTFSGYLDQFRGRDNPFYTIGGQITIPLSNTGARNNYLAAKATREQIALQLKQFQQNILITIENDIATANTRFQQVDATREARIYAEAALSAEQKKLESGKSTSFVVLQLTKDLTAARSAEISALANYNDALAQLSLDEGSTLERRRITLEMK
ncbi:MAG: hypothetical protein QOJ40_1662 [Verrucomicrobiota bacterium]